MTCTPVITAAEVPACEQRRRCRPRQAPVAQRRCAPPRPRCHEASADLTQLFRRAVVRSGPHTMIELASPPQKLPNSLARQFRQRKHRRHRRLVQLMASRITRFLQSLSTVVRMP
mmetsp:Transcript_7657/g.21941  ORF Transcript_7657/g.21941 Transcript_7657/m.21941 type:complete len:115 (+) Transcript_7657:454-798(+)